MSPERKALVEAAASSAARSVGTVLVLAGGEVGGRLLLLVGLGRGWGGESRDLDAFVIGLGEAWGAGKGEEEAGEQPAKSSVLFPGFQCRRARVSGA